MRRASAPRLLIGIIIWSGCSREVDSSRATGTIELTQSDVAATVASQVVRVAVEEGAWVNRGDTLVLLTQSTLPGDIEGRRARLVAAEAELRDLLAGARQPELDRARAELASAESEAERSARDAERLQRLMTAGGISQSELDRALSTARMAAGRRDAAREVLQLLQQGSRPERIQAARAAVASARANLSMAEAVAADLVLTAPTDGVVLSRLVEPGEVLAAGVPAISLGDPRRPWIRVFVSAPALADIRLGQRALVTLEGVPDRVFEARVVAISPQAEFTPRVAMTESERADLLFGVKLDVTDTTGVLKAGLPATVVFDTTSVVRPE